MRLQFLLPAIALAILGGVHADAQDAVIVAPAGAYTFTAPQPVTIEHGVGFVTFRWGDKPAPGPGPAPAPPPPPVPTPTPQDVTPVIDGHAWAVVLYDPATPLTAPQKALVKSVTPLGTEVDISLSSQSSAESVGKSWMDSGKIKLPLPAVVVIQKNAAGAATIAHQAALPEDFAEFATLFGKLRGKVNLHSPPEAN